MCAVAAAMYADIASLLAVVFNMCTIAAAVQALHPLHGDITSAVRDTASSV